MRKGCLIAAAVVFGILSILLGYYFYDKSRTDPTIYKTEHPAERDIILKTVATGSIKPRKEVQVKPQVSGVVDVLFVEEGEIVEKGQPIARVKLVPSEVNINSAQSSVELARIRLREAEREYERQKSIFENNLDVESAEASFENAKLEFERQKSLLDEGIISQQEYNRFELDRDLAKAAYDNAKIASKNQLDFFQADVDIRKQELDAAINNLQLLREGATKNSGQVSNVVASTLAGMILDLPVEEGSSVIERNTFNEGTSIAVVADMNTLVFEGKIDESEVGKIREGMSLELTVGAIDDLKFDAVLEHIAPQGVLEEGTVKFEILAAVSTRSDVFLRAGYSASGDIILDRRDKVLSINERDMTMRNDSSFVDVEIGEQEFETRQVTTGLSDGILIEVLSGIDSTDKVKILNDKAQ